MIKKIVSALLIVMSLAACKAEDVEVRVSTSDLQDALTGEDVSVRFIARFELFGELDDEKRSQLKAIEAIAEDALEIDDYQVVAGAYQTVVTVEGDLPVIAGTPGSAKDVFALYVFPNPDVDLLSSFTHRVEFGTGRGFNGFESAMKGISFMLSLDASQPISFRLRADSGADIPLLAGGGQMEGRHFSVMSATLPDGERTTMIFKDGAYDEVSGAFLLALPK